MTDSAVPPVPDPDEVAARNAAQDAADSPVKLAEPDGTDEVLDIGLVRRYKQLRDLEKAADAEKAAFKEEADKIEAVLVDMFTEAGTQNINIDGKTVYLHRSVYARRINEATLEDVKAALRAAGAGDLVTETVNANTLSAWVRELTEDDDAPGLPEPVADVLEPGERFSMRINAAGSKSKAKTHSK